MTSTLPPPPPPAVAPDPAHPQRRHLVVAAIAIGVLVALAAAVAVTVMWVRALGEAFADDDDAAATGAGLEVARVVDGDTIEVRRGDRQTTVRLIGIDTPETKDPRKPVQCFGREATAATSALLPPGTEVRLEPDVERRDRYDRVLAYVYRVSDGLFVNLELARQGYADLLTYPPNVAHTSDLSAAVAAARREQLGLWRACGGPGQPADPAPADDGARAPGG